MGEGEIMTTPTRLRYATILLALAGTLSANLPASAGEISRDRRIFIHHKAGSYRAKKPPQTGDPVPALGEKGTEELGGTLSKSTIGTILDDYIDRMTRFYTEKHGLPEDLVAFLDQNRKVRDLFVTALSPRYDDIPKAAGIIDTLRKHDEARLKDYPHLAVAIAVVYDQPDAILSSRYRGIGGIQEDQFPRKEPPDPVEIFDYYTDAKLKRFFRFDLKNLPWQLLIHLVDNDASTEERDWARSKFGGNRTSVAALYPKVPYDYDKMNDKTPKLGKRPYSLENILQYGGVCGDQAHFASRVAKSLGVPAMKVTGKGRYGGNTGHCWLGFLAIKRGKPSLDFAGRYFNDFYYTGGLFDPQTRTNSLDRFVAMMYDGVALSYDKFNSSELMVRMAEAIRADHPKESLNLTTQALKSNYYTMWGWPLFVEHTKAGTVSQSTGLKWLNDMVRALAKHPDMTIECLDSFLDCVPKEDLRKRQSLYNQVFVIYKERPDLQLRLRMAQCTELVEAGKPLPAINVLIPTVVANSKEGTLVLPAVKLAVKIAKEQGVERQAYPMLKKADSGFPKQRGNMKSEAYAEFKELLDSLKQ
jgi:hypothetical protein